MEGALFVLVVVPTAILITLLWLGYTYGFGVVASLIGLASGLWSLQASVKLGRKKPRVRPLFVLAVLQILIPVTMLLVSGFNLHILGSSGMYIWLVENLIGLASMVYIFVYAMTEPTKWRVG